jgi:catechol 2,3-dioxygenase-like lactoylglutathione lyase family enzyme
MLSTVHLRIARPTNDLSALLPFYCDALGFRVIASFQDHDGFDGVMLAPPPHDGQPAAYHLEFTTKHGHTVANAPTPEHLLVFYLPDAGAWAAAVARLQAHGYDPLPSFNPYWDVRGKTFADPDGYRVVLQNAAWQD